MAQYIVLHTLKKSPEEVGAFLAEGADELARATAAGAFPAKCIKTWNPMPHGRTEYIFCLWEADKLEDVETSLKKSGVLDYLTADTMEVDEIDWEQLAKAGA